MAATATLTSIAPEIKSPIHGKHDMSADLVYFKRDSRPMDTVDWQNAESKAKHDQMVKENEEAKSVVIQDIRGEEQKYTLDVHGFQYVRHEITGVSNWSDEAQIKEIVIPETEKLVREITGASKTVVLTHRVRCYAHDERAHANNQAPAHSVHTDFSPVGARHIIESVIKDENERERLLRGRVQIINVWRPLKTVHRDPLAVCDYRTVDQEGDFAPIKMIFPHDWAEMTRVRYNEAHKWYYLHEQRPDEPLLFKQYDSKSGKETLPHSAFVIPETEHLEPRESIEIKMCAFHPED
ncbi:hypothetical protein M432DRAFT_350301 [Thermoascus aurantiacus ATCC 26904]